MPIVVPVIASAVVIDPLTLSGLVRELSSRMGELVLSIPTSDAADVLSLVDTSLHQYLPADTAQLNLWVYGAENVVAANSGFERRARAWDVDNYKLVFYQPGWPTPPTAVGVYEIHTRHRRVRVANAINSGVGELDLAWGRDIVDASIVTVENTWRYALPSSQNWISVQRVEIESNTDDTLSGYPYSDAMSWNYRVWPETDSAGTEIWYLQFGTQPPPGRILRVFGTGYYAGLTGDTSRLVVPPRWQSRAIEWIMQWGEHKLAAEEGNRYPAGQNERYRVWSLDRLNQAKDYLLTHMAPPKPSRLVVPGQGDGQQSIPGGRDYFGAFSSGGFS